jgi:hypothetical protein
MLHERRQLSAKCAGVLGVQVDLVLNAAEAEPQGLVCRTSNKVVFERHRRLGCHLDLPGRDDLRGTAAQLDRGGRGSEGRCRPCGRRTERKHASQSPGHQDHCRDANDEYPPHRHHL